MNAKTKLMLFLMGIRPELDNNSQFVNLIEDFIREVANDGERPEEIETGNKQQRQRPTTESQEREIQEFMREQSGNTEHFNHEEFQEDLQRIAKEITMLPRIPFELIEFLTKYRKEDTNG